MDTQQERSSRSSGTTAQPARRPRKAQPAPSPCSIRGAQVLYVDDEPLLRRAVGRLLGGAGASCLLAGTHEEAVAMVTDSSAVALAILDFHMPDGPVDGLLKRLRVARPGLPVIGTSGADRQVAFAERGVSCFLAKPWEISDLFHALERALSANPHFLASVPLVPGTVARRWTE